ncbi:MAG: tetratricopeptide repeat protein [Spirochaetaceae bacterium]|jgi:tetratricopeptide (TPR) repeat protein|nr:tetratricopeptide repeat protein [Spirochaetaceae bacterium]
MDTVTEQEYIIQVDAAKKADVNIDTIKNMLDTALKAFPDSIKLLTRKYLLSVYDYLDYKTALEICNRQIELHKDSENNWQWYNNRAAMYNQLGEYDKAIVDADTALQINSEDPYPYYQRGKARSSKEFFDDALQDFNRAIALKPEGDELWYEGRAYVYWKQERFSEAIQDCSTAIRLSNQTADFSLYMRAEMYFSRKQYAAALADYTKVIQMEKGRTPVDKDFLADMYNMQKQCRRFLKNHAAEELTQEATLNFDEEDMV